MTARRWQPGDLCRVTLGHRKWSAVVHFVSADGLPLAVGGYDGIIEGFVSWLPIIWKDGVATTFAGSVLVVEPREVAP